MRNSIKQPLWLLSLMTLLLLFTITVAHADETDPSNPDQAAAEAAAKKIDSIKKVYDAELKKLKEDLANAEESKNENIRAMPVISERTIQIICILFFAVILILLYYFFRHIRTDDHHRQYLGFQSIKLIGLILIFPGICITALVGGGLIGGSTLAALFGTIAGYVLSKDDDASKDTLKKDKDALTTAKDKLIKEKEALTTDNEKLTKEKAIWTKDKAALDKELQRLTDELTKKK